MCFLDNKRDILERKSNNIDNTNRDNDDDNPHFNENKTENGNNSSSLDPLILYQEEIDSTVSNKDIYELLHLIYYFNSLYIKFTITSFVLYLYYFYLLYGSNKNFLQNC